MVMVLVDVGGGMLPCWVVNCLSHAGTHPPLPHSAAEHAGVLNLARPPPPSHVWQWSSFEIVILASGTLPGIDPDVALSAMGTAINTSGYDSMGLQRGIHTHAMHAFCMYTHLQCPTSTQS